MAAHESQWSSQRVGPDPWSEADFRPIAALLQHRLGHLLSPQRLELIRSRLQARLQAKRVSGFSWFHEHVLRRGPESRAMQLLVDLSTINHSQFFRERGSLRGVADRLAELLHRGPVRAWSAGCALGQEPYSLAMALSEIVPDARLGSVEIHGSDLSSEAIRLASKAIYPDRELGEISPENLRRYFLRGRGPRLGSYRVVPEIRRLVQFWQFDLRVEHWPIPGEFDAILCRNVTLYFDEEHRLSLLDRLAERLKDGGWLLLGHCEILPGRPTRLRKVGPSLYRKEPVA